MLNWANLFKVSTANNARHNKDPKVPHGSTPDTHTWFSIQWSVFGGDSFFSCHLPVVWKISPHKSHSPQLAHIKYRGKADSAWGGQRFITQRYWCPCQYNHIESKLGSNERDLERNISSGEARLSPLQECVRAVPPQYTPPTSTSPPLRPPSPAIVMGKNAFQRTRPLSQWVMLGVARLRLKELGLGVFR